MTHKEIINEIMKKSTTDGRKATRIQDCTIIGVHLADKETIDGQGTRRQLSITLNKEVDGYAFNESTQQFEPVKTKVVFTSYYGIRSLLADNKAASPMLDYLVDNDSAMKIILNHAKVTVVQEPVETGEQYINPFSTKAEPYDVKNNSWFNHIESIELTDEANELLKLMVFKALGL